MFAVLEFVIYAALAYAVCLAAIRFPVHVSALVFTIVTWRVGVNMLC